MLSEEKTKKIHQIVDLALDVSQGKPDVFVDYQSHTQQLDIRVYEQGWAIDKDFDWKTILYLKGCLANGLKDFNNVIRKLKKLKPGG